jgi:hypothetical protein
MLKMLFPLALALTGCKDKPADASAPPSSPSQAVMTYSDLTTAMTANKEEWIGKQVVVKGPLIAVHVASDSEPNGGLSLGTTADDARKSDHVNCVFAAKTPAVEKLANGVLLTVQGKVSAFTFSEPQISDCAVTAGLPK